jgi:antitoxin component YwqK of YwqJK toxin-antitoxin module
VLRPSTVYKDGVLYTGNCIEYWQDGTKKAEASFVDGKKAGLFLNWYPNGFLCTERHFKNGKHHGTMKCYSMFRKNILEFEIEYFNGHYSGIYVDYDIKSGEIKRLRHYKAVQYDGKNATVFTINIFSKRVGEWKVYYENGNKKLIGSYSYSGDASDILEGEWIYYNEDGTINQRGTYENNELVSRDDMENLIKENF